MLIELEVIRYALTAEKAIREFFRHRRRAKDSDSPAETPDQAERGHKTKLLICNGPGLIYVGVRLVELILGSA